MLLLGVALVAAALGYLPIPAEYLFTGGYMVSGGLLAVLGLALLYKGASRKEAKEQV